MKKKQLDKMVTELKSLTRDKIFSSDSVSDLLALFFNMSSLNRGVLFGISFPMDSTEGCEV